MPEPTTPSPGRTPRSPRRSRAGRPVRKRASLTSTQAAILIVGGILLATLLFLVWLRSGQDGTVRIEGQRINVELNEFTLKPQSVSVKQGNIEVYATNTGKQVHNLQIETIVPRDSDAPPVPPRLAIKAMQPGETNFGNVTLSPGKYKWRSSIANDDDLGMYGAIEVRQ